MYLLSCLIFCFSCQLVSIVSGFTEAYTDYHYVGCYSSHSFDWDDRESYCSKYLRTNLASIHNDAQTSQMNDLITDLSWGSENIFIGLSDSADENVFTWSDGSIFNYTNWDDGEPNDYGSGEDCTEIYANTGGQWNDISCTRTRDCFACNLPNIFSGPIRRVYNITFIIGNQSSDGRFYFRINGTTTNSWTAWATFDQFIETDSQYSIFPRLANVGDCQEMQILTTQTDDVKFSGVYCAGDYIDGGTSGTTLVNSLSEDCTYLLLNFNTSIIETVTVNNDVCLDPTISPTSIPTIQPSLYPSDNPTIVPTNNPTSSPSDDPTSEPTRVPTTNPTSTPTAPTDNPTINPSSQPTLIPTLIPTSTPTVVPSTIPTSMPSSIPSNIPSRIPSSIPSGSPTDQITTTDATTTTTTTRADTTAPQTTRTEYTSTKIKHQTTTTRNSQTTQDNSKSNASNATIAGISATVFLAIIAVIAVVLLCAMIAFVVMYVSKMKSTETSSEATVQISVQSTRKTGSGSAIAKKDDINIHGSQATVTAGEMGETNTQTIADLIKIQSVSQSVASVSCGQPNVVSATSPAVTTPAVATPQTYDTQNTGNYNIFNGVSPVTPTQTENNCQSDFIDDDYLESENGHGSEDDWKADEYVTPGQ